MADEKRKARTRGEEKAKRGTIEVRAALDRVEDGETAVLLLEDGDDTQLDLPLSRLPEGASDGDHFLLTFDEEEDGDGRRRLLRVAPDEQSKTDAAARIQALQDRLAQKSNTEGKKKFKL